MESKVGRRLCGDMLEFSVLPLYPLAPDLVVGY